MADSVLDVYNQALSAVHAKGRLTSLTAAKREREECDIWYDDVVRTVQEAAHWPGCRVLERLTLSSTRSFSSDWTATDAQPEYKYKYVLPENYLRAWHLTNYDRFSLHYDVANDEVYLSTNTEDAVLVYSFLQEDVRHWTPGQVFATAYGLAAHIVLMSAQASALNAEDMQLDSIPQPLLARGYTGAVNAPKYYYPYGGLFPESIANV